MFEIDLPQKKTGVPEKTQWLTSLTHSIKNYIECLLNTRRSYLTAALEDAGLEKSLLNYGLPDLRHFNPHAKHDVQELCRLIEETIETHETRLKNISVSLMEINGVKNETDLLLCIKATLQQHHTEKEIEFFSAFNRISQVFSVKEI